MSNFNYVIIVIAVILAVLAAATLISTTLFVRSRRRAKRRYGKFRESASDPNLSSDKGLDPDRPKPPPELEAEEPDKNAEVSSHRL
jgi:hypothetical protein